MRDVAMHNVKIPLRYIVYVFSIVLCSFMGLRIYESFTDFAISKDLRQNWETYREYNDQRFVLREELIAQLGYTGLIHNYLNYIIRDDDSTKQQVWISLGKVGETLRDLKNISHTQGELVLLEDIEKIVEDLKKSIPIIKSLKQQSVSRDEIYEAINFDEEKMGQLLVGLYNSFDSRAKKARERAEISSDLRWHMGMNGFISNFKRYVIAGQEESLEKLNENKTRIVKLLDRYKNLDITVGEQVAIRDIETTINKYLSHIDEITAMHQQGALVHEIDEAVKVDDSSAKRGFLLLKSVIIDNVFEQTATFHNLIVGLKDNLISSVYIDVSFLALIFIAFNIVLIQMIMIPIQDVSRALKRLSQKEHGVMLNIEPMIEEISTLFASFRVFKGFELERDMSDTGLRQEALTDELTGLANRTQLSARFEHLVEDAQTKPRTIAVLIVDLDNFKQVNDEMGHVIGDTVLQQAAEIFQSLSNDSYIIARTGGDEFVIVMDDCESEQRVHDYAQSIIDCIGEFSNMFNTKIRVGASIGYYMEKVRKTTTLEKCLAKADRAMYLAKEEGKNNFKAYPQIKPDDIASSEK